MRSELDTALDDVVARLTAPGQMLETVPFERFGRQLPMLKNAPPTLPVLFETYCAQHGEAEFLVDGEIRLTFAQTWAAARAVAGGLVAGQAVQKGDRIGIAARNSTNWIIAYMAVLMAGGCACLLNGWWSGEEMAGGIELTGCKIVLADQQRAARIAELGLDTKVVLFEHDCGWEQGLAALLAGGGGADTPLPELTGDDLATILYTSGSTGLCKGAWSDHRAVTQAVFSYVAQTLTILTMLTEKGEAPSVQPCSLVNVPLFHVTGEVPLFLQSFVIGRKLVLMPKWDAEEAMRLIEREKVTYFVGVPLMSFEIATHPNRDKYDLSSCTAFAAGGAPRPVDHVRRIKDALPHAFPLLGYGLTETNAAGCGNLNENYLAKPGSTGTATKPLVEVGILDDAGAVLPAGTTGEVAFRSIVNFGGYWQNPTATAEAVTADGWFRTGDLGHMDEQGFVYITGRASDMYISGGSNIYPREVEEKVLTHPAIGEVAIVGVPDPVWGEVGIAVCVAREGMQVSEGEIAEYLAAKVPRYKMPKRFFFWEALPKSGYGKVPKRMVKDELEARGLLDAIAKRAG